jgi:GNAT superfamily N-acetyltransferase
VIANTDRIAELEWANYATTLQVAKVTPGLDVTLSESEIVTSSQAFPIPDANHACLLRTDPKDTDRALERIIEHYQSLGLPTTIYLSPACRPTDLSDRLLQRGFAKGEQESWMVLTDWHSVTLEALSADIAIHEIDKSQAITMAQIFMVAFGMPVELAPLMAGLIEPAIGLPGVHYYLAFAKGEPVGVCSLHCHERFAVLGSAGVLPAYRGTPVSSSLGTRACWDARQHGVETLMLQTTADTSLERFLRINGFKRMFTRTCYTRL